MNSKTLALLAAAPAALAVSLLAAPQAAVAQDAAPLSFNVGVVSDYRYRGISQSRLRPAIQGGVDYAIPGGFYVGAWASSIKWIKDAGGGANAEIDLYGGFKGTFGDGIGFDVGALTYQYPGHDLATSPNTTEVYGALSFGPATAKYSHSVTNLFGFADSKNSGYLDLTATFDMGEGFSLAPHIGYQRVAGSGNSDFSYWDYALTVSKEYFGIGFSAAVVGAQTKDIGGVPAYTSPANGKNLGKAGIVIGAKKTF